MKTKNIVAFLTTVMTCLCVYYLSFTWMDIKMNQRAIAAAVDEKGNVDLYKKQKYLDSYWDKCAYKIFGKEYTYEEIKNKTLNLGLDLQGGMSVTLEISIDDLIVRLANKDHKDVVFKTIKAIPSDIHNNDKVFWDKFSTELKNENPELTLRDCFVCAENEKSLGNDDAAVLKFLKDEVEKGIQKAFDIISFRIDKAGTTQPVIQRLQNSNKVQVELAGARNPERTRQMLQGVARLQFWNLYKEDKVRNLIDSINNVLEKDKNKNDDEAITLNHYMVYNVDDVEKIQKILDRADIKALIPKDLTLMWANKPRKNIDGNLVRLYAIKTGSHGEALLEGDALEWARPVHYNGELGVSMQMNNRGTKLWKRITSSNIGNPIAISMDNKIYSAPVVNCEIPNGASQISGNFTEEEVHDLSNALSAGSLPTTVKITEETIVGPTLSEVAQKQGMLSVVIGLLFTFLFLILFYAKSGIIADIALLFNCLFLVGTLVQCGVVMTLSGIAGIVLTIGMAIDANVLINERIKEELRRKRDIYDAVALGYSRAGWTIFDSNITTFMTGLILFLCGRGVIRGFATTLMTGIATSFFTSFLVTKYLFNKKVENDSLDNMTFSWSKKENFLSNLNFGFVKFRKFSYLISILTILAGFTLLFKQGGLKMGVDFTGGRGYVVKMSEAVNPENLKSKLCELTHENVEVKTYGADNILKIQTNYKLVANEKDAEVAITNEILDFISKSTGFTHSSDEELKENTFTLVSSSKIEPSIANDFKKSAQRSIFFALLVIFLYIFFRFFSWQFGLVSLVGLTHDVLMTFAAFGILRFFGYTIEIDQVIIGAILTIIGYSINGTIVVLSRIRENAKSHKFLEDNVDASINETLTRTLITSLTTIAIVVILLIFGGEVLRNFASTLLLGLVFGTYSSIFIATPLLRDLYGKNFPCSKLKA